MNSLSLVRLWRAQATELKEFFFSFGNSLLYHKLGYVSLKLTV